MGPNFNCDLSLGLWCDPLKIMYTSLIRLLFHIMCDDNTNYSLRLFILIIVFSVAYSK